MYPLPTASSHLQDLLLSFRFYVCRSRRELVIRRVVAPSTEGQNSLFLSLSLSRCCSCTALIMDFFNLLVAEHDHPTVIKEEVPDRSFSLLSPPITPSLPSFSLPTVHSTTSRRGASASILAGPKRPRPYPSINRGTTTRKEEDLGIMSTHPAYGTWTHTSATKTGHSRHPPSDRKTSDREDQSHYSISAPYMTAVSTPEDASLLQLIFIFLTQEPFIDQRTMSSTLTGAMGDANISHSRHSRSPSSTNSGHVYTGNIHQNQSDLWNTSSQLNMTIAMNNSSYPGVPGHGGLGFQGMNHSDLDMSLNEYTTTRNGSPDSHSPHSPNYPSEHPEAYRNHLSPQLGGAPMGYHPSMNPYASGSPEDKNSTIAHLQRKIRELEMECSRTKSALQSARTGLPTAPRSASFQASWRARTEMRKKQLCSLNRAGNALCAWHDSRRERRAFPPRNAPPGYLNCGCTYEEALFEESLTRQGVGSYRPGGETVRMDPALRNPLLKLLEKRYGYKDGDFEHDPITETWSQGQSPAELEQGAQSSQTSKRRTEADRH